MSSPPDGLLEVVEPATAAVLEPVPRPGNTVVLKPAELTPLSVELGPHALDAYTEVKSILYATS
jgi:hypothetical protein